MSFSEKSTSLSLAVDQDEDHKHDFRDRLVEVRCIPRRVGIFQCGCGHLFPRPLTEDEANLS